MFMAHRSTNTSLREAYEKCEAILRPTYPLKPLTAQDVDAVDEYLKHWEESSEISATLSAGRGPLVDAMTDLLKYVSAIQSIPHVDIRRLHERSAALLTKIRKDLLLECRKEEKAELLATLGTTLKNDAQITEDADSNLLRKWADEIDNKYISRGPHTENWYYDSFPRTLTNLETFAETLTLSQPALEKSTILSTLTNLATAPTIAATPFKPSLRKRARSLITKLFGHTNISASYRLLDLGPDPEPEYRSPVQVWEVHGVPLEHRLEEAHDTLSRLKSAASAGDAELVVHALQDIERWGPTSDMRLMMTITQSIRDASASLQEQAKKKPISIVEVIARADRLHGDLQAYSGQSPPPMLVGKSYRPDPTKAKASPGPWTVIFKDIESTRNIADTVRFNAYMSSTDHNVWDPVTITLPLLNPENPPAAEPIDALFSTFVEVANEANRHPLSPSGSFDFTVDSQFLIFYNQPQEERKAKVWDIKASAFVQGLVGDFLGDDIPEVGGKKEIVVWFKRHDGTGNISFQQLREARRPAYERRLPSSCYPPPSHWVEPTPPPLEDGTVWRQIPTMSFVGNGSDIHHHVKWPPVISKHLFVPISFEPFGLRQWEKIRRVPVSLDVAPVKLQPPLTLDQARSLLGKTILYELPDESGPAKNLMKRKREPVNRTSPYARSPKTSNDYVSCAFVWGLDPEKLVITLFETDDTRRTFWVGKEAPTDLIDRPLPYDFPSVRKIAKPNWIGEARIPAPVPLAPGEEVPEAEPESTGERVRTRWDHILEAAPKTFEVGIEGDDAVLVGELTIQGVDGAVQVDNCKRGIWESGYFDEDEEGGDEEEERPFTIWAQWVKAGTISLTRPASAFKDKSKKVKKLSKKLAWTKVGDASVDGGMMAILASGYVSKESRETLMEGVWKEDEDVDDDERLATFIEMVMLSGAEDGRTHIPGGISMYTGGDGGFAVYASYDRSGKAVAIKVTEGSDEDDDMDE